MDIRRNSFTWDNIVLNIVCLLPPAHSKRHAGIYMPAFAELTKLSLYDIKFSPLLSMARAVIQGLPVFSVTVRAPSKGRGHAAPRCLPVRFSCAVLLCCPALLSPCAVLSSCAVLPCCPPVLSCPAVLLCCPPVLFCPAVLSYPAPPSRTNSAAVCCKQPRCPMHDSEQASSLLSTPYRRRGHVTTRLAIPMRLRAAKRRTTRVFREKSREKRLEFRAGLYCNGIISKVFVTIHTLSGLFVLRHKQPD